MPDLMEFKKFSIFLISWSEDITSKKGSIPSLLAFIAAKAIAGAVPLPKGSNIIDFGLAKIRFSVFDNKLNKIFFKSNSVSINENFSNHFNIIDKNIKKAENIKEAKILTKISIAAKFPRNFLEKISIFSRIIAKVPYSKN